MNATLVLAAVGVKAFYLLMVWLASAIAASELSRRKGYGEKVGLGTGLVLSILGPIIWLFVPPKDATAEWHERKPWQRRQKPREADMTGEGVAGGSETAISQ